MVVAPVADDGPDARPPDLHVVRPAGGGSGALATVVHRLADGLASPGIRAIVAVAVA